MLHPPELLHQQSSLHSPVVFRAKLMKREVRQKSIEIINPDTIMRPKTQTQVVNHPNSRMQRFSVKYNHSPPGDKNGENIGKVC